jgi:phosphoribosylformylglycinamidine (FGAM) synthase PurS component
MKKFKVTTKLHNGIKDIEGDAIKQKLNQDDWSVSDVKVGQVFYLEVSDTQNINELCKQVLVNTLLYNFEIEDVNN